jgi:integrase
MPRPRRDGQPSAPIRKVKFTAHLIRNLKPEDKPYLIWDTLTRGLAIAVQPSGGCAYKFVYGYQHKLRWYSIGDGRAHPLADVRKKARELRVMVDNGIDPQGVRVAERGKGTFLEIADRYRDEYAKKRNKSWAQADALVRRFLVKRWGSLPAASITRAEVRATIAKIEAPIVANQTLASASAVFSWAVKQELISVNPCHGIERNPTQSRERVLSDTEIPLFWPLLDDALRLMLLLGQRPSEVLLMRREHIKDGWWELPGAPDTAMGWRGTKNGQNHRVWVPRAALDLIGEGDKGFVLAGRQGKPPRRNLMGVRMAEICRQLKVERATPHDLRRTHGTLITSLRFGRDALNRVQNHKEGGIASVYDRHSYSDENQAVMEAVANRIMELVSGVVAKVVHLPRR